jgi:5-methylcytosine-specific restriction protein A
MFDDLFGKPRRAFNKDERESMRRAQGGRCAGCGKLLRRDNSEADHAIPFAYGGPTSEFNGQMLCKTCHRAKTARQNRKSFF